MMTVAEALSVIIDNFGISSFGFPDQIRAMVLDYVGNEPSDDIGIFCTGCRKEILCLVQQIYESNDNKEAVRLAQTAKTYLMDKQYMQEKYAVICVNMFLEGVGNQLRLELTQRGITDPNVDVTNSIADKIQPPTEKDLSAAIAHKRKVDRALFRLLCEAEQAGNINAMIRLGDCYQYGEVVERNYLTAEFYYIKAKQTAEQLKDNILAEVASSRLIKLHNSTQHDRER